MKYPAISAKIIDLKNKDLELRNQLLQNGELHNGYHEAMAKLHHKNAAILNKIIDSIGYPTINKVGKEGNAAAWLIIQHSIGQPAFMKKCAQLLEEAVQEEKANPIHFAYLTDRIAVFEGKPQRYGTQFDWDENGVMNPNTVDDLEKVNQRRKSLSLNTLEAQTQIMQKQAKEEKESPPKDFFKKKADMDKWRKSVGWIK